MNVDTLPLRKMSCRGMHNEMDSVGLGNIICLRNTNICLDFSWRVFV